VVGILKCLRCLFVDEIKDKRGHKIKEWNNRNLFSSLNESDLASWDFVAKCVETIQACEQRNVQWLQDRTGE
jgi:hypothetical protein